MKILVFEMGKEEDKVGQNHLVDLRLVGKKKAPTLQYTLLFFAEESLWQRCYL